MNRAFVLRFTSQHTSHSGWWWVLALLTLANGALSIHVFRLDAHLLSALDERALVQQEVRQQVLAQADRDKNVLPAAVADRLSVPWGQLLDTLARTTPGNMRIVQLTPDASYRVLQWTVETDDLENVATYLRDLDHSGVLGNAHLSAQSRPEPAASLGEPVRAWKLTFRGEWAIGGVGSEASR